MSSNRPSIKEDPVSYNVVLDKSLYSSKALTLADAIILASNSEAKYGSKFATIHKQQGKEIGIASKDAHLYTMTINTLKLTNYTGLSLYFAIVLGDYYNNESYDTIKFTVPENDIYNHTLSGLVVALYNETRDLETVVQTVRRFEN